MPGLLHLHTVLLQHVALVLSAAHPLTKTSTGELVAFWTFGPIAIICALSLVFAKNAVHAALFLVVVMFSLAIFYVMNQAPFLAAVEVIVYAGAIMILFLFVLMLVGVDSSDSLVETLRGHRAASVVLCLGVVGMLVGGIGHAVSGTTYTTLTDANAAHHGNVQGIARLIFTTYVFPFEVVSALLIVAAVGAMILAHREKGEKVGQRELMKRRVAAGGRIGSLPGPGVFARHDDAAQRALLPDGTPDEADVLPEMASMGTAAIEGGAHE